MSHSSSHALSTRLFLQAAVTGLLAPLTKGGSTWLVITFAVAAGAVGVAMLLRTTRQTRRSPSSASRRSRSPSVPSVSQVGTTSPARSSASPR